MRFPRLASSPRRKAQHEQPTPGDGTYVTDGASLFRVAGTLLDTNNETLVELEDCGTLELILLPMSAVTGPGLRAVRVGP
jgi:hypothetical protein